VLRGIDHLVIAVDDRDAAADAYRRLGFTVVIGGRHAEGTHNALIAFADGAYLELLAFYEPSPAHRWWAAHEQGGGLIDYCLASDDPEADAAAFRRAGVDIGAPEPGARLRPDGYRLRWRLAKPRGPHRGVAPFLIDDDTPRDERVPRERSHANRVTGLGGVTVAVDDLEAAGRWYAGALGRAGEPVTRPELDARGLRFAVGPHLVELLAPRGAGAVAERLRARGAGPLAATLAGAGAGGTILDPTLAQGARLILA
jgi:catechol 2,3-dioxygenase-like lactoylglutathione lyase family enzyme